MHAIKTFSTDGKGYGGERDEGKILGLQVNTVCISHK